MKNKKMFGRSMLEMLGVLAIIGVLSIGAVSGFRYAMNKLHANRVVNDASLVYGSAGTTETEYEGWTAFANAVDLESGLEFMVSRVNGVIFIRARSVPEDVCRQILRMRTDKLKFYPIDKDDQENVDFETKEFLDENCSEGVNHTVDMIFAFDDAVARAMKIRNCYDAPCQGDGNCEEGYIRNSEGEEHGYFCCSRDEFFEVSITTGSGHCEGCPENATCNGVAFTCNNGCERVCDDNEHCGCCQVYNEECKCKLRGKQWCVTWCSDNDCEDPEEKDEHGCIIGKEKWDGGPSECVEDEQYCQEPYNSSYSHWACRDADGKDSHGCIGFSHWNRTLQRCCFDAELVGSCENNDEDFCACLCVTDGDCFGGSTCRNGQCS